MNTDKIYAEQLANEYAPKDYCWYCWISRYGHQLSNLQKDVG